MAFCKRKKSMALSGSSCSEEELLNIPFELVEQILWRLPVKPLLQFRTVCNSWNSLISDPKFAKNHLPFAHKNITRHRIVLSSNDWPESLRAYPLYEERRSSIFNGHPQGTPLSYPRRYPEFDFVVGSCDGILCFTGAGPRSWNTRPFLVWNPCIRKFKELRPLNPRHNHYFPIPIYGFGYDHSVEDYKVVAGFCFDLGGGVYKSQVNVNNLRTNVWRRKKVQDNFPGVPKQGDRIGRLVSGALNWLLVNSANSYAIVSFDLGKETYREIPQPDYGVGVGGARSRIYALKLEALRDCLSIIACVEDYIGYHDYFWVMKEYGNKMSWTKLFTIPHSPLNIELSWYGSYARILCILQDSKGDDALFMRWGPTLAVDNLFLNVHSCHHDSCMFTELKPFDFPGIYVESLISSYLQDVEAS